MLKWLGAQRISLRECSSTNDEAEALANSGAVHGTVVVAEYQRAGRGQKTRAWHSPLGGVYLSCILRPAKHAAGLASIGLATGLGVCDAICSLGIDAKLKWPNDVLVERRKLAGILCEMKTQRGAPIHVILGIGVNVNNMEFPRHLTQATSIQRELGTNVDKAEFVETLLFHLENQLDRFLLGGVEAIAGQWTRKSFVNVPVRVQSGRTQVKGLAMGVDKTGAFLVKCADGKIRSLVAGSVTVL